MCLGPLIRATCVVGERVVGRVWIQVESDLLRGGEGNSVTGVHPDVIDVRCRDSASVSGDGGSPHHLFALVRQVVHYDTAIELTLLRPGRLQADRAESRPYFHLIHRLDIRS